MSEMAGYPDSYYAATAVGVRDCPALEGERKADVCVGLTHEGQPL